MIDTAYFNLPAIDRSLSYHYLPGSETLLQGVSKLDPGHCLTVEGGRVSIRQYWDLQFGRAAEPLGFDEAADRLRALLRTSVEDHMISDVPVGVLLSGGVDSTAVLSLAAARSEQPLHTFTMGFEGRNFADERPYARMAAEKFGTLHHEITMSAAEFQDFLPRYAWHMEEPVCEPPAIGLFFVSQLARRHSVKVLLSGEGGDEAFGGYPEYRNLLLLERLKRGFGPLKGLLRGGFSGLAQAGWKRGSHYASLVDADAADYYCSRTATPWSPFSRLKSSLYRDELAAACRANGRDGPAQRLWRKAAGGSLLDRMLYVDTKTWLPDDLLVKADKMTMATSVELRVPLLDSRILEFAASLPDSYKVRRFELKRLLKAAVAPSVPPAILSRKKTGFPVPYAHWLRHEMKEYVHDSLMASDSFCRTCFSAPALQKLLEAHQRGEPYSKEIFSLLVLESWHRQFIGPALRVTAPAPAAAPFGLRLRPAS